MYYTEFDWLEDDEIATVLPEDGLPPTLHIDDLDDEPPVAGMSKHEFQDWIWEGRHDCEVALAMLRMWVGALRGSGSDTIGDFIISYCSSTKRPRRMTLMATATMTVP